jgi:hypothetical protein
MKREKCECKGRQMAHNIRYIGKRRQGKSTVLGRERKTKRVKCKRQDNGRNSNQQDKKIRLAQDHTTRQYKILDKATVWATTRQQQDNHKTR